MFDEPERRRPSPPPSPPISPGRSRAILITAVVLVVAFLGVSGFSAFWTERLWYRSVGFSSVFSTLLWTRVGLFLVFGAVMAAGVALNMVLAYRARPLTRPGVEADGLDRYRDAVAPIMGWLLVGVSLMLGAFAGTSAAGNWRGYALWRNGSDFGVKDPYFDQDVGFYVFSLPWWHYLTDFVMALAVLGLLAAMLVHYLYGGIRLAAPRDRLSGPAQVHLSALLGLFVLAKAADYWLDRYDLVTQGGSVITGMNYTDDKAVLPGKEILMGIAVICAVLFFLNIWRRTWLLPSVGIALFALSAILLGLIVPGIVQQFQVNPNVPDKEGPYIARNIEMTREAYALDDIEVESYTSAPDTTGGNLGELDTETSSIPLVDPAVVSQTFEQQQQVRAYYSVSDVLDVDHYDLDGTDRALVLGVRELEQSGLAESDQNWSNLHTVYTHGNGIIAAYANQRPENDESQSGTVQWAEGQDDDESALTDLDSDGYESRVYFGEGNRTYSIVGKREGASDVELDLPKGGRSDENLTTTYDGAGGVPIGNLFSKTLYAIKFTEPNLVLSSRVHGDSKILYDRDPGQMVKKVAPWLTVDSDPYPAVIDGKIQWIVDGYTMTDRFPQSQRGSFEEMTDDALNQQRGFQTLPTDEINYMRNAVKATVDAYDGTVRLYAWEESDPILQAWRKVFPGVVEDKSAISEDLMAHVRYPEDLFKVQRYQFQRYHETNAKDWFEGSSRWEVPKDPEADTRLQPPYRLFLGDTWSLTSVYVPREKNNLASFVSVNSDATSDDYGQITVRELTNERTDGPRLIANELRADEDVREELLSFTQGGAKPVYGNLLTLPVGEGLMYVQPLYAQRSESETSFPILRFVLVSYDGTVGIGTTLYEAIADVLGVDPDAEQPSEQPSEQPGGQNGGEEEPGGGEETEPPSGSTNAQIRSLLQQAEEAFDEADEAQANGNTVKWARLMEEGRQLIEQAVELSEGGQAG